MNLTLGAQGRGTPARGLLVLVLLLSPLEGCREAERLSAATPNIERIQGTWQSTDDAAATIAIRGNAFLSRYDDVALISETIHFVSDCERQVNDSEGEYFVLMADTGVLCYRLSYVDETLLEYIYLPRGNTLSYTRLE